jgi:hypothetical protein
LKTPTDSDGETEDCRDDRFIRDFAVATAGYIAGHGVLRFFAAFLVGLNDSPRALLIERWIPLWNAVGYFLVAWGAFHFVVWIGRVGGTRRQGAAPTTSSSEWSEEGSKPLSSGTAARDELLSNWKPRLKELQKRKDVGGMLDLLDAISKALPAERSAGIDRRLGRWFTKHFQRRLLSGKAAESLEDVERVAAHYENAEEFAYFKEILPVVRQCAELKQSLREEEEEQT